MRFVFALLLFQTTLGLGQEHAYSVVTEREGLPSNTVYNLFLDSVGFLWIATENGLARYNGYAFNTYSNNSIRSNAVSGLSQDESQRIWLHNFFGEILFVENDSLKKLDSWEAFSTDGFPTLSTTRETILVSAPKAFYSYSPKNKQWFNLKNKIPASEQPVQYNHHIVNRLGHVLICYASQGITYVRNLSTEEVYTLSIKDYKLNASVLRLIEWEDEMWLFDPSTKQLLSLKNRSVETIQSRYAEKLTHTSLIENIGDTLLAFAGSKGLHLLTNEKDWIHLLPNKHVSSVASDREGGLWVGTLQEGLFHFPNLYTVLLSKANFPSVLKLAEDKRNKCVYAGAYDGSILVFTYEGKLVKKIPSAGSKEVQSLYVDTRDNRLLVFSDKLYAYQLPSFKELNNRSLTAVKKIERIGNTYALATSGGLLLVDTESLANKENLSNLRTSTVAYNTTSDQLWIGSQKGVLIYSYKTKKVQPWLPDSSVHSPGVSAIIHQQQTSFLGTNTNGLFILKNGHVTRHITKEKGLPSSHITALALVEDTLWIGTDKGIATIHLSTQTIQSLNASKGLTASEVYDVLMAKGTLWISHPQGLQYFTKITSANKQPPTLHVHWVSSDKEFLPNPLQGIILQPSSQQLTITFDISNNLRSRGTSTIHYRIKELEKEKWNQTTLQSPSINYLSLPSGKFTFEAYAQNEDGIRSKTLITIPIEVLTPFWKQRWFSVVLFLLSLACIAFILYRRFRQITERNKILLQQKNQEQELRIAQLTSIRAQMNPHFIFNTMSLIQGKVLNGLKEDANRNIQNFSLLLRKVLDFSGKEMIALPDEIEILEKYLSIEKDRFDGSLEFTLTLEEAVKQEMIRIPSLLTQPFVENALRHGLMHKEGLKKLSINFTLENDALLIRIDDNGIGRKASAEFNKARKKEHNSFALEAYQKRIELLNSTRQHKIELHIIDKLTDSGMPAGTRVIIKVPLEA